MWQQGATRIQYTAASALLDTIAHSIHRRHAAPREGSKTGYALVG